MSATRGLMLVLAGHIGIATTATALAETAPTNSARAANTLEQRLPTRTLKVTRPAPTSHEAAPIDPPLPPPTAESGGPRRAPIVCGHFTSVQVNTNAAGANIVGDAANEPSIAIPPTDPNTIVLGWRQFDNVHSNFREAGYAYSHDDGQTWTSGALDNGVFRTDPVLDCDSDGVIFYYSLRGPELIFCDLFKSFDGGVTWTAPTPAQGGDKAWFAIDRTNGVGAGNFYVLWNPFFSCCDGIFTRSTDGGASFINPIDIPGLPRFGTVAVGPDGAVLTCGAIVGNPLIPVSRSQNAQDAGAPPVFDLSTFVGLGGQQRFSVVNGPSPAGILGQIWIAADHSGGPTNGFVYLFSSVGPLNLMPDPLDVRISRSTDGGATWSSPVLVNDGPSGAGSWQWFGTLSISPDGRLDAVWNSTLNEGAALSAFSQLRYAYSLDAGATWSSSVALSPPFCHFAGYPNQNKLGDYYQMISDELGAKLAYAATFNGEQDVYYVRIGTFDCNGNGVADAADVASGRSADANGNGVPDECDPDCNGNDVPDSLDIAGQTSPDADANGVPDECQVVELLLANPPTDNPFVPGQQPFRDVLDPGLGMLVNRGIGGAATPPVGTVNYSQITLVFNQTPLPALTPAGVNITCVGNVQPCPVVSGVTSFGNGVYRLALDRVIPPAACTTFTFTGALPGQQLQYQSLPGDLDMNGTTTPADVLWLVTGLQTGQATTLSNRPRYDVNRNNSVNPSDVVRLVQLLNGLGTVRVWSGVSVAACP